MRTKTLFGVAAAVAVFGLGAANLRANISFLSVDDKVTLVNNTTAVITGTVLCDVGDTLSLVGNVVQEHSGGVITQGSEDSIDCTGFLQTFVLTTTVEIPADGTLKKGPATVLVGANTDDGVGGSDNAAVSQKGHIGR